MGFVGILQNLDLPGCHEIWICRIEVPAPKAWEPGCLAKPFYLFFSSLQSSFEREILVRTNTFFIFFGTEALKAKNLVHERWHLPRNLVS